MEKQFVTYEIALKLKDLGFNGHCLLNNRGDHAIFKYDFTNKEEPWIEIDEVTTYNIKYEVKIPLWQQVIDWLYKNYKILISPYLPPDKSHLLWLVKSNVNDFYGDKEQAILKAIEIIKI